LHLGAEQGVEEGEVGRVVFVDSRRVAAVVPVVKVGCDDQLLQKAPAQADVGVVKHGLEAHDQDVGVHHAAREAEHVDGPEDRGARDDELEDVHARACQPVHDLGAVVHRVEAPQVRHLVIRAMRPILDQVGHQ
jgi:hypothetical protein